MGKRTLESNERKLNWGKVIIALMAVILIIVLLYFAIKGIINLLKNNENDKENSRNQNETTVSQDYQKEKNKTIEEILAEFGGQIIEQVKNDTYYVSKAGKDYTIYLDGEILNGRIIPWDGNEAKPAIDEAGNINIYSAAELAWVANQVISGEKNFSGVTITLRNNIDLGARENEDGTWDGPDWKPIIGFLDELPSKKKANEDTNLETVADEEVDITNENLKRFDGIFNGNGCKIRGMKIDNNKRYQGLFGYVSGIVSDLTLKYSKVNGGDATGAIVGLNEGRITNCIVENTDITGKEKVGGLVGISMTDSVIENSSVYENCEVIGNTNVGGLIGYVNNNVTIKSCSNGAVVRGKDYVGGIAGIAFYGTSIENSFNFSQKIEGENYVGGLVGYSAAQIEKSHNQILTENTSEIIGKNYVGGIVGLNYTMGDINECFNNVKIIILEDNCGGIAGLNNANISNCYNKGEIDCSKANGLKIGGVCGQNLSDSFIYTSYNIGDINNTDYAGGLVGADFGKISNSFCLDTCLKTQNGDTEYKKTEEELKNAILSNLGNSFKVDSEFTNSGYPILNWQ